MDILLEFLSQYGYWGMLIAAFLAGSFFPFSSEAVMLGFMAAGLDNWTLIIYGTVGNVLGSLFNYGVGRMGRLDWVERYLHVKKEELDKAQRFMAGRGAWMASSLSSPSWAAPSPSCWVSCVPISSSPCSASPSASCSATSYWYSELTFLSDIWLTSEGFNAF